MRCSSTALFIVLTCAAVPVYASGWYLGIASIALGRATDAGRNVANAVPGSPGSTTAVSFDDQGLVPISVFGGYQFDPYMGAEVGDVYFGNYTLLTATAGSGGSVAGSETDKPNAIWFAVVGTLPINQRFSIFGKAGLAYAQDKMTCTRTGSTCASALNAAMTPMFGMGGQMNATRKIRVRLEYDQYNSIGNNQYEYTAGTFYQVAWSVLYRF
ncbi:MAG: outer membrane beta-barrel protein [Acidiferrobacteraceae bacterium]